MPRLHGFDFVVSFLVFSLVSVTVVSVISAYLVSRFVEQRMLSQDVGMTTEFINQMFAADEADHYFSLEGQGSAELAKFFAQVGRLPDVLRANIYLRDGTVLWSTDPSMIGRRFVTNNELAEAAAGRTSYALGVVGGEGKEEHGGLGQPGQRFVENYIPIFKDGRVGGEVLGVMEIYRVPRLMLDTLRAGQQLIVADGIVGALLIFGPMVWLARRADRVMRRQEAAIAAGERLATAGEMAAAVAHGLRNPLASIRSSAELAMRLRQPERVHELLQDIITQSDRLEHWVRQYLTAVEPAGGDLAADLATVLATVRTSFAVELERNGIVWREALAPGLPRVRIGTALLEQVVNGLVANAIQAMQGGGRVTVTARRGGDAMVEVEIEDNGDGMSPERLDKAFLPFVTSKPTGMGLGLPLARRVMERHGGTIALRSSQAQGTVAILRLRAAG